MSASAAATFAIAQTLRYSKNTVTTVANADFPRGLGNTDIGYAWPSMQTGLRRVATPAKRAGHMTRPLA